MDIKENHRKRQNQEKMDVGNIYLYHDPEMSSVTSDTDSCIIHKKNVKAKVESCSSSSSSQSWMDEGLSSSVTVKTGTKPKQNFQIKKYEEKWDCFYKKYLFWRNNRINTISKLQELLKKVHDEQLNFNKANIMFKELNVNSRMLKKSDNSTIDFFASLGTFLTDAASGITSVAQAFNVDACNIEFKKIMEDDAEITKSLYRIRSQCLEQYRDIEEMVRSFHSVTFDDTLETVSKTLKIDDLWLDLKNGNEENPVSSTINCLDRFISKNANAATVNKIYDSFEGYVDSNPAVLDACKSAGKVMYGIYDTWGRDQKQREGLAAETSHIANEILMQEEKKELCQLRSRVNNSEMTQAKLESKIEDAIDSLQSELSEISSLFNMHSESYLLKQNPY